MTWQFKSWGIPFPCSLLCWEMQLKLAVQAGCRAQSRFLQIQIQHFLEETAGRSHERETAHRFPSLLSVQWGQGYKKSAQTQLANFCWCSCQQVQRSLRDGAQPVSTRCISGCIKPPVLQEKYPCCCLENVPATASTFFPSMLTQSLGSPCISVLNTGSGLHQPNPELTLETCFAPHKGRITGRIWSCTTCDDACVASLTWTLAPTPAGHKPGSGIYRTPQGLCGKCNETGEEQASRWRVSCFPVLKPNHSSHSLPCEPSFCQVMKLTLIKSLYFTFKHILEVTNIWVQHKVMSLFRSTSSRCSSKQKIQKKLPQTFSASSQNKPGQSQSHGSWQCISNSLSLFQWLQTSLLDLNMTKNGYAEELWM